MTCNDRIVLVALFASVSLVCAANSSELEFWQKKADAMKANVVQSSNLPVSAIKGTCYYISSEGSDANDGKSPGQAFATPERLVKLKLNPGDAVLFRRGDLYRCKHDIYIPKGVTVSAWGEGPKPVLCGSQRNYADPSLWQETQHPGIWKCTIPLENIGLITFNHDPREVGRYDVLCGTLVPPVVDLVKTFKTFDCEPPLQLQNDLEFWADDDKCLYLRSTSNPGSRFKRIEIASAINGFYAVEHDLTFDNLRLTLFGRHGISGMNNPKNLEVKNCIFDYIGGAILYKKTKTRRNVRYGNAVEIYGGCSGFRVHNNWIYQIYDTGITHQCVNEPQEITHENVEYWNNLIEYCYWSIEYYNKRNKYGITRNVYVHDNFCRFGGEGWGCTLRRRTTPMYSFAHRADKTENYRTENNIFQFSEGFILSHKPELEPDGALTFKGNTYIQKSGQMFAEWGDAIIPAEPGAIENFLKNTLKEKDFKLIIIDK